MSEWLASLWAAEEPRELFRLPREVLPLDGASVPQFLWWLYPPFDGDYDAAAVVHDYLYRFGGVTRAEADAVLREGMEATGTAWRKRILIYAGVRVGGWKPWGNYRRDELEAV